jgi:hypothetical protein
MSGEAAVYEFPVNFTADNEYAFGFKFAENDMEVKEGDAILVYRFVGVFEEKPIWSQLPQTIMFQEGILKYEFVHTDEIFQIGMDAQFDLADLGAGWTTDQGFRMVIIPGSIRGGRVATADIDYKNYEEVAKYYNISEANVKKLELK